MNMKLYTIMGSIVTKKDRVLSVDICSYLKFMDVFEISEMGAFILSRYEKGTVDDIVFVGHCDALSYVKRVNFESCLRKLFGLGNSYESGYTGNSHSLQEMKVFSNKNEFYAINERILTMLLSIGLSEDTAHLVLASLGEIIDNAFSHNLGRWETSFGPSCLFLAQNYSQKRTLSFAITDLGVGFHGTLGNKYPELANEASCIEIGLKPGITGRYQDKGGNGLVFLQKNIFNGFQGELHIRSNDTLVQVKDFGIIGVLRTQIPITGTSIYFHLHY